jgi:hypothetical protein
MPQNTAIDLQNHLMEALERLNDDELMSDPEVAKKEIKRASAISTVARVAVQNEAIIVRAETIKREFRTGGKEENVPLLTGGNEAEK